MANRQQESPLVCHRIILLLNALPVFEHRRIFAIIQVAAAPIDVGGDYIW
jgi:hypothetical protein